MTDACPHLPLPLTAITGGIGSGKSVVSRILRILGHPVYDTDAEAKQLMDTDQEIRTRLAERFGAEILLPGSIDRPTLSRIVFASPEALADLNAIVHAAVRADIEAWAASLPASTPRPFVETAILYESRLDRMVTSVWDVTAPIPLRIERVMARNGLTAGQVQARIDAQSAHIPHTLHPDTHTIVNDNLTPLLPQIQALLR